MHHYYSIGANVSICKELVSVLALVLESEIVAVNYKCIIVAILALVLALVKNQYKDEHWY